MTTQPGRLLTEHEMRGVSAARAIAKPDDQGHARPMTLKVISAGEKHMIVLTVGSDGWHQIDRLRRDEPTQPWETKSVRLKTEHIMLIASHVKELVGEQSHITEEP